MTDRAARTRNHILHCKSLGELNLLDDKSVISSCGLRSRAELPDCRNDICADNMLYFGIQLIEQFR